MALIKLGNGHCVPVKAIDCECLVDYTKGMALEIIYNNGVKHHICLKRIVDSTEVIKTINRSFHYKKFFKNEFLEKAIQQEENLIRTRFSKKELAKTNLNKDIICFGKRYTNVKSAKFIERKERVTKGVWIFYNHHQCEMQFRVDSIRRVFFQIEKSDDNIDVYYYVWC